MRNLLLAFFVFVASFQADAGVLRKEVVEGQKKICIYSDGTTIVVSAWGVCPQIN